ncbi:MAG: Veg protein [Clostridiales bacterium]|nr:Veg protein [Clostridiales bacterium]
MVKEGDSLANQSTLDEIRKNIEEYIGQEVTLRANKGRRKIMVRKGVLENTYPSVFIVKINGDYDNAARRVSYSYSDILTETVEITINQNNEQIRVS